MSPRLTFAGFVGRLLFGLALAAFVIGIVVLMEWTV